MHCVFDELLRSFWTSNAQSTRERIDSMSIYLVHLPTEYSWGVLPGSDSNLPTGPSTPCLRLLSIFLSVVSFSRSAFSVVFRFCPGLTIVGGWWARRHETQRHHGVWRHNVDVGIAPLHVLSSIYCREIGRQYYQYYFMELFARWIIIIYFYDKLVEHW